MTQYRVTHPALEPLRAAHEKADKRYIEELQRFLSAWPEKYRAPGRNFSLSALQRSPKQRILGNEARKTAVINPANQLWSLMGTHIHAMLEEYPHGIRERRLGYIIPELDVLVHHQPDWLFDGRYTDYKNVSSTSMKYDKQHWEEQFNFGAWLFEHGQFVFYNNDWGNGRLELRQSKERVDNIFACVQLLDWRPNNPQTLAVSPEGSMVIEFPKWEPSRVLTWATERARIHQEASQARSQEELPLCTLEEQWERETGYKVYAMTKKGEISQKAATSEVFPNGEAAFNWAKDNDKGQIEIREVPGTPFQCLHYCEARSICLQGLARVAELPHFIETHQSRSSVNPST